MCWYALFALLLLVVALLAAAPWAAGNLERETLDDSARAAMAGHDFVRLSGGVTHYAWHGPEHGHPVVLVHGFSSPMFIWDRQVPALVGAGFRVLRYDLFGRGYSDRPAGPYNEALFDRQLADLLDSQGLCDAVDLIGLSMGGAIAVHFTVRHPERVRRLGLIAPAGMMQLPRASRLLTLPGIGWWILRVFGDRIIVRQMPRGLTGNPDHLRVFMEEYARQLRFKGYKRALRATMRDYDLARMDPIYEQAGKQTGRSGMLIWGTADTVVDYTLHERVLGLVPWLNFQAVDGGGHAVNYELSDTVNRHIIDMLIK